MTVYICRNGDDENDGSENAPVKSPKRAIAIANRNNDQEINLLTTDWARINRGLGVPRMSSHRAADRPGITSPCSKQDASARHRERLGDLAAVALVGVALFTSLPSRIPVIENDISLIEFAREKVTQFDASKSECRNI